MTEDIVTQDASSNPFNSIRHKRRDGSAYWSARELMPLLGYDTWRNFAESIERARAACDNAGQDSRDHFVGASKMIQAGKGAEREVLDYHLTRYACYLVAMNGDPRKAEIAGAQTYFAIKTHEAERAAQAPALPLSPLTQARLMLEALEQQDARVTALEIAATNAPIRSNSGMRARVHQACQAFGKVHSKGYSGAYRAFKEAFGFQGVPLAAYDDLPQSRLQEALNWLDMQIKTFSAQRPLLDGE